MCFSPCTLNKCLNPCLTFESMFITEKRSEDDLDKMCTRISLVGRNIKKLTNSQLFKLTQSLWFIWLFFLHVKCFFFFLFWFFILFYFSCTPSTAKSPFVSFPPPSLYSSIAFCSVSVLVASHECSVSNQAVRGCLSVTSTLSLWGDTEQCRGKKSRTHLVRLLNGELHPCEQNKYTPWKFLTFTRSSIWSFLKQCLFRLSTTVLHTCPSALPNSIPFWACALGIFIL